MQVQVEHGLPRAPPVVENCPIAIGELAILGKLRGDELQLAKHGCVLRSGLGQRDNVLPRADEDVAGRLRLNIFKREDFRVLVYDFRLYFFFSDLAEQAVVHKEHPEFRVYSWA